MGGGRIDVVTSQCHFHCQVAGKCPWQPEQPSGCCDQGALDLREAEPRRGRGDDQVAGQDQLHAAGHRWAVDGGDEGLGALTLHQPCEAAPNGAEAGGSAGDGLEVGASAEGRSVGGEYRRPCPGVLLEAVDGLFEGLGQLLVDGVAGLGSVEADDRRASVVLVLDDHWGRR